LLLLYSLTFFFANYGPNTTTFILPSLVFSPECRSTLNGLAAAGGKSGALAGATLFAPAADTWGDATVMFICSAVAVVAFVMTQLFVQIPNNDNHHTAPATRTSSTPNERE
jgi:MFS transporter, PHS family, inorganic phosphate transporter